MRTIVPFVLSIAVFAQPPRPAPDPIERLEKKIADSQATVQDHVALANLYAARQNDEGRRKEVFWLIENHPEIPQLRNLQFAFDGPRPDAAGLAQALDLWRAQAAKPDAGPKVIANAAWFLRFSDPKLAWEIADHSLRENPGDSDLARVRGSMAAMAIGGVNGTAFQAFNPALRRLPAAQKARDEIDASHDAALLAGASEVILQHTAAFNDAPAMRGDDATTVAERWLLRARELDPKNIEVARFLSNIYDREASQSADPHWKVELYRKAEALSPGFYNVPPLAMAEYEAGDNEAAARTAKRILDQKSPPPQFPNMAHTVLGLIALDQKRMDDAKRELLESARGTANIEPNRTLAQALLDAGERDVVLQYLEMCRTFWKGDRGAIDHYIKMAKAPGTHDIVSGYSAGQELRGRPSPKLPIDNYEGKIVAVQFRNAACKDCTSYYEAIDKLISAHEVQSAVIDSGDQPALVRQLEIDTFPTVVLIDSQGRVADVIPGRFNENYVRIRLDTLSDRSSQGRKLAAPATIIAETPGTLAWKPVAGAESYVVQWDQRDEKGWQSDRDDHLVRVIPSHETSVALDPSLGETVAYRIRWRVIAVNRSGPGTPSQWNEIARNTP